MSKYQESAERGAGSAATIEHEQLYPAAFKIIKQQRNDALDRVAVLEADLASERAMTSKQSHQIIDMAERLAKLGAPVVPLYCGAVLTVPIDRSKLTEQQRADLDAANSSVQ